MIDEQTASDVAAALRLVGDDIDEDTAPLLRLLANRLDGAPVQDDEEPNAEGDGDLEQEAPSAMPAFEALMGGRYPATVILEREPVITDIPIPGQYHDATSDLADMLLEARGIRTELPAHDGGLPIPNLDPVHETSGLELTLEGMPIPGDTIQQSAQLMLEPQQRSRPLAVRLPTKPATEYAGGMPLPDF